MYRTPLANSLPWRRRAQALALAATCTALTAQAQTPAPTPSREPVKTLEQKTERITHEDAGSRIDEVRVGGETRSIDVQTRTQLPGYQVQPMNAGSGDNAQGNAGKSSWRVLKF